MVGSIVPNIVEDMQLNHNIEYTNKLYFKPESHTTLPFNPPIRQYTKGQIRTAIQRYASMVGYPQNKSQINADIYEITNKTAAQSTPPITSDIQYMIDAEKTKPKITLKTPEELEQEQIEFEALSLLTVENIKEEVLKLFLNNEIAYEDHNLAEIILNVMLSAYTPDPLNLRVKAPSSSGKTYVTMKIASCFPKDDIIILNKASPQSWLYSYGKRIDRDGNEIDESNKPHKATLQECKDKANILWSEVNKELIEEARVGLNHNLEERLKGWEQRIAESYIELDIRNKIIILIEASDAALSVIKPLISHDSLEGIYRTQNNETKKNMNVKFNGYAAFLINDAEKNYGEEIETRFLVVTPTINESKIDRSLRISLNSSSDVLTKKKTAHNKKIISKTIEYIRDIRIDNKIAVIPPFMVEIKNDGNSENDNDIISAFSKKDPRAMRDFNKYLELSRTMGILDIFHTPLVNIDGTWCQLVSVPHLVESKKMFDSTLEATKSRLPANVLNFFKDVIQHNNACSITQLCDVYNKKKTIKTPRSTIRDWVNKLETVGFVEKREDAEDMRETIVLSLIPKNGDLADYGVNAMTDQGQQIYEEFLKTAFDIWWSKYESIISDAEKTPKLLNTDGTSMSCSIEDVKRFVLTGTIDITE